MSGLTLAAAASIAAGMSLGAVATIGVTLAVDARPAPAAHSVPGAPAVSGPFLVNYGDRCIHGHCLPCNSKQSCENKLPPGLRP